jgi:hypothetical protein
MIFHRDKEIWKCKKCGFETNEEILYLTHLLESHPEITKEKLIYVCEFYKTYCNRIKYFIEEHGKDLPEDELLEIGKYLADNDFKKFDKWLFYFSFEQLLESQTKLD